MKLTCEWCNREFNGKRSTARFCSTNCRTANHRYDPVAIVNEHVRSAISHAKHLDDLSKKHPELSPEIYEKFSQLQALLYQFTTGDNYKRVVDEQNRRLI